MKEDLSFMPITKLKKIKNKMDLLVGAIVPGYCEEGLKYCECDIHSQQLVVLFTLSCMVIGIT